jgi:hypothetical protein
LDAAIIIGTWASLSHDSVCGSTPLVTVCWNDVVHTLSQPLRTIHLGRNRREAAVDTGTATRTLGGKTVDAMMCVHVDDTLDMWRADAGRILRPVPLK